MVSTTFNNCGRAPPQDSIINQSYEKRVSDLKIIYEHSLNSKYCLDSTNYSCTRKIYSPHLKDSTRLLKPQCLLMKDGSQICPSGLELVFNTQAAIESCGASCSENFDYEDAQCSLILPNLLGENAINEFGQNLEEALSNAYQGCQDALTEPKL